MLLPISSTSRVKMVLEPQMVNKDLVTRRHLADNSNLVTHHHLAHNNNLVTRRHLADSKVMVANKRLIISRTSVVSSRLTTSRVLAIWAASKVNKVSEAMDNNNLVRPDLEDRIRISIKTQIKCLRLSLIILQPQLDKRPLLVSDGRQDNNRGRINLHSLRTKTLSLIMGNLASNKSGELLYSVGTAGSFVPQHTRIAGGMPHVVYV